MDVAIEKTGPTWRNFAAWAAVGAVFYVLVIMGGSLLVDGAVLMPRNIQVAASLGLGLVATMAAIGFSSRKQKLSVRTLRIFAISNVLALGLFLAFIWAFRPYAAQMSGSAWSAAMLGAVLVVVALLGSLAMASAHKGVDLMEQETAEDMRDRSRPILYSLAWIATHGLLLIALSQTGPGGVLPVGPALAGALALIALETLLGIATWRLLDELDRTLSNETSAMAFHLIWAVGGLWAILAHLGLVAVPEPLTVVTTLTVLLFVATFIVLARRKLIPR